MSQILYTEDNTRSYESMEDASLDLVSGKLKIDDVVYVKRESGNIETFQVEAYGMWGHLIFVRCD